MDLRLFGVIIIGLFFNSFAEDDVELLFDYCQNETSDHSSEQLIFECLKDEINSYPRNELQDLVKKLHHHSGFQDAVEKCMDSHRPIPTCDPESKYRTLDGSCNNLVHPTWGRTGDCLLRFLPGYYSGTHGVRRSVNGGPLPPPRNISASLCSGPPKASHVTTFLFPIFGQFVAHEMSASTPANGPKCCPLSQKKDPRCIPIVVQPDDPFYGKYNVTCLEQLRSDPCNKCTLGKRQAANQVTASLDGSNVYGTTYEELAQLRTFDGTGRLVTDRDLLPSNDNPKQPFCPADQTKKCFKAGDSRVNQHSGLMSMHTVFMREHNRLVTQLKILNPNWTEEQLFQEGRKILGGILQVLVYKELLPPLLGPDTMSSYNLSIREDGLGTAYSSDKRLGIWVEHTTAAFRLHNLIGHWAGGGEDTFRDLFSNWQVLRDGNMTELLSGMRWTPSDRYSKNFADDMSKYFMAKPGADYGGDMASLDISRGRDHGLPPYVKILEYCSSGELTVDSFDDLTSVMSSRNIELLRNNYDNVQDIDAWVGMIMEKRKSGALIGWTASCIVGLQFQFNKYGDRFFFEHAGETPSFTPNQRESLKNSSFSRLLCDNSEITQVQPRALMLPGPTNPTLPCNSIPAVDLTPWKE